MGKMNVINLNGEKVKDINLNKNVFDCEANEIVLKKAIDLQLASLRQGTQKTKSRAEVSGGGRKPYKQKGTGNARQGSIRAPHYRGGGVALSINPRSYTFKMNKKERALALRSALSLKAQEKKLVIVDSLEMSSLKTKDIKAMLNKLNITGKVLFVTSNDAENLYMGSRNLNKVNVILAEELNVFDIVNSDTLVIDEAAVAAIEEVLN
ncbi:MAG: 50S ribosomal protein L4 [Bacilli bacterium]|jgi:large subunit ribosomal protein L4|nr:50S ribosomal protein L4 [Bacilli bacterium]CDA52441.1 50S ribosomal protein L4 [Clostridium sp. CAG:533]